jgi:hypothetical protein
MTEVVIVIPQRWTPSVEWKPWGKHTRCRSAGMLPRTWSAVWVFRWDQQHVQ